MNILLIGCGSMGGALLKGWLNADLPYTFAVAAPNKNNLDAIDSKLKWYQSPVAVPQGKFDVFVIGVTPMFLENILRDYKNHITENSLVISMVAGKTIAIYKNIIPKTPVVRIMPNLPVSVQQGITICHTQDTLSKAHKSTVEALTSAVGKHAWLEEESLMNAATALAGCGPGFIFELTHTLAEVGKEIGLPRDVAETCARQMVIGSGAHLAANDTNPKDLSQRVAHKGSMTEAGLDVLRKDDALKNLLLKTLAASVTRGKSF